MQKIIDLNFVARQHGLGWGFHTWPGSTEYPMKHTNFQGHQPFGSGEDFLRILPYMGMVAMMVMWPEPFEQTFVPPSYGGSIWNLTLTGPVVSEEKTFKELKSVDDSWQRPPIL